MSPELASRYFQEFFDVFAPAPPPNGWERLIAELDDETDRTIAMVDAALRKHCEVDDCFDLADIGDLRTKKHYCEGHAVLEGVILVAGLPYWRWRQFELDRQPGV